MLKYIQQYHKIELVGGDNMDKRNICANICANIIFIIAITLFLYSSSRLIFPDWYRPKVKLSEVEHVEYYGILNLPSVEHSVPVYTCDHCESQECNQKICDAEEASFCYDFKDMLIIGDHNYQGFECIKEIEKGDIATLNGKEYVCVNKSYNGVSDDENFTMDGMPILGMENDLVLFTCNETQDEISVVLFDEKNQIR